jgi:hypothetical protein
LQAYFLQAARVAIAIVGIDNRSYSAAKKHHITMLFYSRAVIHLFTNSTSHILDRLTAIEGIKMGYSQSNIFSIKKKTDITTIPTESERGKK